MASPPPTTPSSVRRLHPDRLARPVSEELRSRVKATRRSGASSRFDYARPFPFHPHMAEPQRAAGGPTPGHAVRERGQQRVAGRDRALPAEGHSHPPANSAWPRVGEAEFISRRVRLACAAVAKWVPFSAICRRPGLSLAIHRLGEIHCRFLELLIGGVDSHE